MRPRWIVYWTLSQFQFNVYLKTSSAVPGIIFAEQWSKRQKISTLLKVLHSTHRLKVYYLVFLSFYVISLSICRATEDDLHQLQEIKRQDWNGPINYTYLSAGLRKTTCTNCRRLSVRCWNGPGNGNRQDQFGSHRLLQTGKQERCLLNSLTSY